MPLLAPYKRYAEIKAEIAFAEAAISFAYGNFASGAKFLAAGVAWTAVAGLIGAAGLLISEAPALLALPSVGLIQHQAQTTTDRASSIKTLSLLRSRSS